MISTTSGYPKMRNIQVLKCQKGRLKYRQKRKYPNVGITSYTEGKEALKITLFPNYIFLLF